MFAWFRRVRARLRYRRFDADLRQEIETHRAMVQDEFETRGLPPADARVAAARALGNVTLQREQARAVWLAPWIESVWQDVRYGVRSLLRSPAYSIATLVTMIIGIGLNTAMFTLFNVLALKPWPVENARSIALLSLDAAPPNGRSAFNLAEFEDLRQRTSTLAAVAASRMQYASTRSTPDGQSQGTYAQLVTPDYFDVLGVPLHLGRFIRDDENREGAHERVAVISHRLWLRLLGGVPDAVGRTIYVRQHAYVVVGVARAGWNGPIPFRDDLWLPLQADREISHEGGIFGPASERCCVGIIGRLAPGSAHARVQDELTMLIRQRASNDDERNRRVLVSGTAIIGVPGPLRVIFPALMFGAAIIIILLTGANIAHLQVARMQGRQREVQTRMALGAGRFRVARQIVTESLMVALVAGTLSLAVVYNLTGVFTQISEIDVPGIWAPDVTVFAYCLTIALVMSLVFGLAPALRTTRASLVQGSRSASTAAGRLRFSAMLLTTQIALSTALLTGAVFLTRAVAQASTGGVGYTIEGVTIAAYFPSESRAKALTAAARTEELRVALSASSMPPAAIVDTVPFGAAISTDIRRPTDAVRDRRGVYVTGMSSNGFEVLGIPFAEGRPFVDRLDANEVVVNERLARTMWPGESALGQRLIERTKTYTVVGVTRDVYFATRDRIEPTLHRPAGTMSAQPGLLVRSDRPVADQLKTTILGIDPGAKVTVRSLSEHIAEGLGDERAGAQAAWVGGLVALALAAFGVFGVFTHVVEDRRREIGIRLALGGQRGQVLGALFKTTRLSILGGLSLGLVMSLATGPMLEQFLYGLSPFDPIAFMAVSAILAVTGLLATYLPARRALSVDPAVILKEDP